MITITVNTENGAEARKELLDLLGINTAAVESVDGFNYQITKEFNYIPVTGDPTVVLPSTVEEPTAEKPKTRRKATAELKPETVEGNTGSEEPPAADEAPAKEVKKLTLDDAKLAAAQLSRAGFRNEAKEIAYKYAAMTDPNVDKEASLVPKIAPENYEAFIAEIEAVNR